MRYVATASFSYAVALVLSRYFIPHEFLLVYCCVAALLSLLGLFFQSYTRFRIIIVFLSLSLGFCWNFFHTEIFVNPSKQLHEQAASVSAVVFDFPVERNRGYRVDVKITQPGKPPVNARLYYNQPVELKPGEHIDFTARFRSTLIPGDGERLDFLNSRGIFLSAYATGSIEISSSGNMLLYFPRMLSRQIADKIAKIFPGDVAPLMQSLLTGYRSELNRDVSTVSALTGAGIIHIVSISGMHVAFLMGFLGFIIKDKRLFTLWALPVLLLFMAMSGFTPAVTRAGVMQIFLLSAPLFRRESDSITSLSSALLLLLIINPYSIASVGLQLSFSATLGIMLISPKINHKLIKPLRESTLYKNKATKYFTRYIITGFATTIGALIFTYPLTALHFGYISLIAPLTNLLTLWAVSIAFPVGLIASLIAFLHNSLSTLFVVPVTFLARYIIFISQSLAAIPYSSVYSTNAPVMFWLCYVYILFITLPLIKARLRQYILPVCTSVILLCIILLIPPLCVKENTTSLTVLDVGQGLSTVLITENLTAIIDCGSNSGENAGAITHEYLVNRGRTGIDLLIITHFHADHINGVEFLLSRMPVSALAIPDPENSFLAEDIINLARRHGTDIIYVTETLRISLPKVKIYIYPPLGDGDENERGLSVLTVGGVNALVTGDMNSGTERALLRFAAIGELDVLVVGHHGSRHSTSEELLNTTTPTLAVIPVGRNSFGHPTDDVLKRLESAGSLIYRTDHMGHITVNAR